MREGFYNSMQKVNIVIDCIELDMDRTYSTVYSVPYSAKWSNKRTWIVTQEIFDFVHKNSIRIDVGGEFQVYLVGMSFMRLTVQNL